jgi:glucan 1,3-beta-glucosidase
MEGTYPGSYFVGSCAGKSGRVVDWSQDWKDNIRRWIEVQLDVDAGLGVLELQDGG